MASRHGYPSTIQPEGWMSWAGSETRAGIANVLLSFVFVLRLGSFALPHPKPPPQQQILLLHPAGGVRGGLPKNVPGCSDIICLQRHFNDSNAELEKLLLWRRNTFARLNSRFPVFLWERCWQL